MFLATKYFGYEPETTKAEAFLNLMGLKNDVAIHRKS